jgi:hypothetical protein
VFHYIGNAVDQKAAFSPKSGEPRWRDAVKIWNQNADRMDDVSYKVCTNTYLENLSISLTLNSKLIELLKVYYTKWKLLSHVKETLSLSADAQKPLSLVIHVPLRSTRAPAIPHNQLRLHHATKGLLDISTTPSNSSPGNKSFPGSSPNNLAPMPTSSESASVPNMVGSSGTVPLSTNPSHDNRLQVECLVQQRVADSQNHLSPTETPNLPQMCHIRVLWKSKGQ